jgi:hypothetical protein
MHRKAEARVDTAVVSTRTDNVARRHLGAGDRQQIFDAGH